MNKILANALLALVLAPASQAQAPHSNLSISALPQHTVSPPVVTRPKRSVARVLKTDDAAALQAAAKLFPKNSFERAAYLIKVGKPLLALPELDKVLKANPNSVEAYLSKAKIFNDLHRLDESQSCSRKALTIQPDYQPARILLATVAIQKGDLDVAMKELGQSFGFALATKSGAAPVHQSSEVQGGLLAPLAEFPGAWILQSLHMMLMPAPTAIAQSTTLNSDKTFESAAVAEGPVVPLPPPKLTALKPIEDKQEEIAHLPPQKSSLVFTREAEKPIVEEPPKPEKKNPLKFISDEEESTIESAEVPAEKPLAVAKSLPVVTPVISPPPPEIEEPKPAPLQFDPGNLEKSALGFVASASSLPPANIGSTVAPKVELSPPDQWTEKLKYLSEHGTAELADGEAFMFAEDTGEATLFLADGKKIRRVIAVPRDNDVVVATRRPELLKAEDLVYRLALLAKLMPSAAPLAQTKVQGESPTKIAAVEAKPASAFNGDPLLGRADSFVGWLKHLFPF